MRLLNLGCGATRPPEPWTNLDNLHPVLSPRTVERAQLDSEPNYINHDLSNPLPFPDDTFDGILCSHVLEHFDCHEAARIIGECKRVLRPDKALIVSVPDADFFLVVHEKDKPENAKELFGEPICPAEPWHKSFCDYALFHHGHKQVLTHASLACLLLRGGFDRYKIWPSLSCRDEVDVMNPILNRLRFSAVLYALK
jgi:predicted SAM-dependent methyltransferase